MIEAKRNPRKAARADIPMRAVIPGRGTTSLRDITELWPCILIAVSLIGLAVRLYRSKKEVPKIFATIEEQIENMRLLSYLPADPLHDGQFRSVELKPASNNNLKPRFPKGYCAAAP